MNIFTLRRSTRIRKNVALDFPEISCPRKKRTHWKRKKLEQVHQQLESLEQVEEDDVPQEAEKDYHFVTPAKSEEHQQPHEEEEEEDHHPVTPPPEKSEEHQQPHEEKKEDHHLVTPPQEKSEEHQQPHEGKEEDHHPVTPPPGHAIEAEVAANGGVEVIDICPSPEETKPQIDHLSQLQSVFIPNYLIKVPQENLEEFRKAAVVLKSAFVSHMEKLAHTLDITNMIVIATECVTRVRALGVDCQAFLGEVSRLIMYCQKLKKANEGKNLELKADYENSVIDADDAKGKLHRAEEDLLSATTNQNSRREKIETLKEILGRLEAEQASEGNRRVNLTAERNRCHDAHSRCNNKVNRLYSELERIQNQNDAAKEEIQRSLGRLKDLA